MKQFQMESNETDIFRETNLVISRKFASIKKEAVTAKVQKEILVKDIEHLVDHIIAAVLTKQLYVTRNQMFLVWKFRSDLYYSNLYVYI